MEAYFWSFPKQNLNGRNDEPIFFDEGFIDGERAGNTPLKKKRKQ